jgi:DNA-binding ferritin-like protein
LTDTQTVIDHLNLCFSAAESENQQGIADFVAGRIDAMGKHRWMLRSFLKEQRA